MIRTTIACSEEQFDALCGRVERHALRCSSMCNLLPATVPVTGPQASGEQLREYLDLAFSRAARLDVKKLVFGSAGARRRGAQTREDGVRYQIPVLIEAMRRGEADYINTLSEAAEMMARAREAGCSRIGLMADLYHMRSNGEPLSDLERYLPEIAHVHLCEENRGLPDRDFSPYLREAATILRAGGYDGTISYESGRPENNARGKTACDILKKTMTA